MEDVWTKYARVYELVLKNFSAHKELTERFVKAMMGQAKVLDIGCGPGIMTEPLSKQCGGAIGIDFNKAMIEEARRKKGIRFEVQDAAKIEFPDGTFDGAISNNVIYAVPDPKKMLSEAFRVLKKGGKFALSGPLKEADTAKLAAKLHEDLKKIGGEALESYEFFVECNKTIGKSHFMNLYTLDEIKSLLDQTGFRVIEADKTYLDQSYFVIAEKD